MAITMGNLAASIEGFMQGDQLKKQQILDELKTYAGVTSSIEQMHLARAANQRAELEAPLTRDKLAAEIEGLEVGTAGEKAKQLAADTQRKEMAGILTGTLPFNQITDPEVAKFAAIHERIKNERDQLKAEQELGLPRTRAAEERVSLTGKIDLAQETSREVEARKRAGMAELRATKEVSAIGAQLAEDERKQLQANIDSRVAERSEHLGIIDKTARAMVKEMQLKPEFEQQKLRLNAANIAATLAKAQGEEGGLSKGARDVLVKFGIDPDRYAAIKLVQDIKGAITGSTMLTTLFQIESVITAMKNPDNPIAGIINLNEVMRDTGLIVDTADNSPQNRAAIIKKLESKAAGLRAMMQTLSLGIFETEERLGDKEPSEMAESEIVDKLRSTRGGARSE